MTLKKSNHYVDKETLHNEILQYQAKIEHAKNNGLPEPQPSRYIGEAIINMVNGMAMKGQYRNYTWIDDMISDATIACLKAIKKYNPEKSENPFGFLDKTIVWAFHARIKYENQRTDRVRDMMRDITVDYYVTDPAGNNYSINREEVIAMYEKE